LKRAVSGSKKRQPVAAKSKKTPTRTKPSRAVAAAPSVPEPEPQNHSTNTPNHIEGERPPKPPKETSERQQEDKALVRRARSGDQAAYSELMRRHRRGIERLIKPICRNASSDEIEDLVLEAMTKAFLHLESYSEEYAFSTWLYRIATNHAIDYLRRKRLAVFSISAPPPGFQQKDEDESRDLDITDESWVPEDILMSSERTKLIEEAVEKLPPNYRRIIKLRHNDDLEYEEIAKVLNLPMGTVKVHLHRARAALGKLLSGKL
jgi:RNA polymerase sigma-70 factor, ECF subfamily